MTSAASSSGPGRLAALATAAAWLAAALCSVPPAALAAGSKDGTDPAALDRPVLGELMAETGFYQSMTLKSGEPLYSARSEYQKIEIVEAVHYGKVLVLDGVVQLTERDAASEWKGRILPAWRTNPFLAAAIRERPQGSKERNKKIKYFYIRFGWGPTQ